MNTIRTAHPILYILPLFALLFVGLMGVSPAVVDAQTTGYAVAFSQPAVATGEEVRVTWRAPSDRTSSRDWVGLYLAGASDSAYVTWQYIPEIPAGVSSGTLVFNVTRVGEYEVRMFTNNGYTRVATGPAQLTILPAGVSAPPTQEGTYSARFAATEALPGRTVSVAWTAPSPRTTSRDWIGLYRENAGDRQYVSWQYMSDSATEGTVSFTLPQQTGTYEARIFTSNGYTRVARSSNSVTVREAQQQGSYSVSVSPATVAVGESISASWTAPSPRVDQNMWLGLYRVGASNQEYLAFEYVSNTATEGTVSFTPAQAGQYEVRAFVNASYTRVARSGTSVTVEAANGGSTEYSLSLPATVVSAGSSIVVNWEAPSGANLDRDWIGVYRVGAGDRSYLAYQYISGGPSGTVTFAARTPGTYEFRYFKNNGYTRVATSRRLTVETAVLSQCPVSNLSAITNYPPRSGPIIAFGDSLTAGVGATAGQDYVSQLERRTNTSIVNAGISGNTTEDALARLERDVLSRNPSTVIVWLGGNDILQRYYERVQSGAENPNLIEAVRIILLRITGKLPEPSGITEDETFENLTEVIERIHARGAVVIVIGFSGGVFDNALEARYASVAQSTGSLYVPNALNGVIGRPSLMSDLVHPNNVGYGIVADRVAPLLACTL